MFGQREFSRKSNSNDKGATGGRFSNSSKLLAGAQYELFSKKVNCKMMLWPENLMQNCGLLLAAVLTAVNHQISMRLVNHAQVLR